MGTREELNRWARGCAACVAGVMAIATCEPEAAAQETNSAMAEALYEAAIKLMEEGKNDEACPKLAQSQKLEPAVGTLLYLGLCYERQGKTASAWAAYRAASEAGRKANQPERQKMATERARNIEPQLSRVTIQSANGNEVAGLQLFLDGGPLGVAVLGVAMPVDPGTHTIAASAPGYKAWSQSLIVKAQDPALTISIPALVPEAGQQAASTSVVAPSQLAPAPLVADTAPGSNTQRTVGIAVAGLGVVGLAVGTIYALKVRSSEEDAKSHCTNYPTGCDTTGLDKNAEARDASKWATVGFAAGGAVLLGGAVLYFTAPGDEPRSSTATIRVQPGLAPREAGILVHGTF